MFKCCFSCEKWIKKYVHSENFSDTINTIVGITHPCPVCGDACAIKDYFRKKEKEKKQTEEDIENKTKERREEKMEKKSTKKRVKK